VTQERQPRVGFAGAGNFASFLAESLVAAGAIEVAGVFDPGRVAVPSVLAGARRADSLAALLQGSIDLVVVAGPPSTHVDTAVAALEAGKHVFLEKPMALNAAEAQRIVRAEQASGCKVQVDHVLRFSPIYAALVRLSRLEVEGEPLLGTLRRFAFENDASDEFLPRDHWFWDRSSSGGIAVEHGVHFIEGCSMLKPELPVRVQAAQTSWAGDGAVDTFVFTTEFDDGATASYAHTFTHQSRAEMQLTRVDWGWGKAVIEGWIPVRAQLRVWASGEGADTLRVACSAPDFLAAPGWTTPPQAHVDVRTRQLEPQFANSRSGRRDLSVLSEIDIDLGGEDAKSKLYEQGVVAAFADLADAIAGDRQPACSAIRALQALLVASAAQTAADGGCTLPVPAARPG